MAKNEVAKTEGLAMEISSTIPDFLKGMTEDTRGSEGVTREDLVIPRLSIIQDLSPEIDPTEPLYLPGAKAGMLINTLTRKLYEEVLVIPIYFDKQYLIWKDRKKGGGFGGSFPSEEEAANEVGGFEDPDNWDISDTPTHICMVVSDDSLYEISIPMPKSKAKVSRQWNSMIRLLGGPRFSRVYKIKSFRDKNRNNEKFYNFMVDQAGFPSEKLFKKVEEIYTDIVSGNIKFATDYSDEEHVADTKENQPF